MESPTAPLTKTRRNGIVWACGIVLAVMCAAFGLSLAQAQERTIRWGPGETSPAAGSLAVGDLYAEAVGGVSTYRDPKIPKLAVSDKEARDFAAFLNVQQNLYPAIHLSLLTDQAATQVEVKKHLFHRLQAARKDDTIILFASGHGADDPHIPANYLFLPYDSDPQRLDGTGINLAKIEAMTKPQSRQVAVLSDTIGFGSGVSAVRQLHESQGRVVMTSRRPDELSIEKPELGNSVFSFYFLEGLRGEADLDQDGVVTLKEAYDDAYEKDRGVTKDPGDAIK